MLWCYSKLLVVGNLANELDVENYFIICSICLNWQILHVLFVKECCCWGWSSLDGCNKNENFGAENVRTVVRVVVAGVEIYVVNGVG